MLILGQNQIESEDFWKDDSRYYEHILELGKQLLNKAKHNQLFNSSQKQNNQFPNKTKQYLDENKKFENALIDIERLSNVDNSSQKINTSNISGSNKFCKNCNFCLDKYYKIKNVIHAGIHLLLQRFDHCVNCHASCPMLETNLAKSHSKHLKEINKSLLKAKELEKIDQPGQEIENVAEKILKFAQEVGANRKKIEKARDVEGIRFEKIVDKFGLDELGITDEEDKNALRKLIDEILNVEKNLNTTLQLIRSRLDEPLKECNDSLENCGTSNVNSNYEKENNSSDIKIWAAEKLKTILSQIEKQETKKKDVNIEEAKDEIKVALKDLVNDLNSADNHILKKNHVNLQSNVVKSHALSNSKKKNHSGNKNSLKTKKSKMAKNNKGKKNQGNFYILIDI